MSASKPHVGAFVAIEKRQLQAIVEKLSELGYRTIGPQIADGAVVYDDLDSVDQLPIGYVDEQDGGKYRLSQSGDAWFDYVVGPHSVKNYIFPPRDTITQLERSDGQWQIVESETRERPLAIIGPRSCDLHALSVQDRVFLGDHYADPAYRSRRESLFIVAVNCRRAAATCFCHSMGTGPAVTLNFDLALTEVGQRFIVEIGSVQGGQALAAADWSPCSADEIDGAHAVPEELRQRMEMRCDDPSDDEQGPPGRHLDTSGIRDLLLGNLAHPRWQQIAERCLSCANCTMVCPTCFCSSVEEVSDLTGEHVRRDRVWASCFSSEHSYMSSGVVRKSTASRYRQWLTHKLATWIDQFDTSGCVGCGRCITWCQWALTLRRRLRQFGGRDNDGDASRVNVGQPLDGPFVAHR